MLMSEDAGKVSSYARSIDYTVYVVVYWCYLSIGLLYSCENQQLAFRF
jgi:hypothetical protein